MSQAPTPLRVLVVGGGLGGLCLAQGLHKAGIDVAVYERVDAPEARTQGYRFHMDIRGEQALHECLPAALYELFLATRGQPSMGMTLFSAVDGQLKEVSARRFPASGSSEFVTVGSAVDRLTVRKILLAGLEDAVHFGKEFVRYAQQPDGTVRVFFADGTAATGDVLVGADGISSRIREQFLPHARVIDSGIRWLGGKTLLTSELRAMLPAQLDETFAMAPAAPQSMVFGLVVFRQDPNQAAATFWPTLHFAHTDNYVFWGVLAQSQQLAVTDDELSTMSGHELQRLLLALSADRPPALRALIEQCQPDQTFVLKMRHVQPIEHWPTSNITLLGDAIHCMPPNGSGANTALCDASLLARSLNDVANLGLPLQQVLHDYEVEMLRYGFAALQASLRRPDNA